MPPQHKVRVGRVYDARAWGDGTRVLVDRLWPRGLSKADADIDECCKQVPPSTTWRTWYAHDPERIAEFDRRYRAELAGPVTADGLAHLRTPAKRRNLTLLTATKHLDPSHAVVLVDVLGE